MSERTQDEQLQRPLTREELQSILDKITAAPNASAVLHAAVFGALGPLLADDGIDVADLGPGRRARPGRYAIPVTQWLAITGAATNRAAEWGEQAHIAMELVNRMPSSYDDPSVSVPDFPRRDYRPLEHRLRVSREACDVIAACSAHVQALGGYYGVDSATYRTAVDSWHPLLARLFDMSWGADTQIRRDGPLSLIVTGTTLMYGLIFHPVRRRCTSDGCHATIDDSGTAFATYPGAVMVDHDHTLSYALDAPQPGTWSFHS